MHQEEAILPESVDNAAATNRLFAVGCAVRSCMSSNIIHVNNVMLFVEDVIIIVC